MPIQINADDVEGDHQVELITTFTTSNQTSENNETWSHSKPLSAANLNINANDLVNLLLSNVKRPI